MTAWSGSRMDRSRVTARPKRACKTIPPRWSDWEGWMISLTSPVETRAHGWRAGGKLGALCVATMALIAMGSLAGHLAAFVVMLAFYAAPGLVFFRSGITRLKVLWPFLALILLWHL